LWDRNIDPKVQRTRSRPLASRALSVKTGIVVALIAFACAAGLAMYLNPWRNPLSFWLCVAAVPVIVIYPLAKRVFPVPQLVLSIAWGFAVLISWTAVTSRLELGTWLLWAATILWTLGFDTIYAMADREDDRRIGINSSALFFDGFAPHAVGLFFFGTVAIFSWLGIVLHLNASFWIALALAAAGWTQQYRRLRSHHLPTSDYGQMFRQNVWLGFLLLAGMEIGLLL
jgi:4-hydroxybenzoate polyprenyltransferase